jgi:glutathione S-transferase
MPAKITLWGFSGSTYVRTVRMLLAEKGVTEYEQIPVDVLKGEPRHEEHLTRHPFGKVPVIEVDGFRIIETSAICHYLDAVLPGRKLTPADPKDRARMDMVTGIIDAYGYGPMIGGVAAYHLFPDFVGGQNEAAHHDGLVKTRRVLAQIMLIKGASPYLAGEHVSVADLYLAPVFAYLRLTPHEEEFLAMVGMSEWWDRVSSRDSFRTTQP